LNQRIAKRGITAISFAIIAGFLYLAYFGEKTAIDAIRLLPAGKETGPSAISIRGGLLGGFP
jgi:hypothetical protein